MTNEELELVKLNAQTLALELLMTTVIRGMRECVPQFEQRLHAELARATAGYKLNAFRQAPPEMSDLLSAEFEEAWKDLIRTAASYESKP